MHVISDLHLEHYLKEYIDHKNKVEKFLDNIFMEEREGNVLMIAGDISTCFYDIYYVLNHYSTRYNKIFYVLGDAEYTLNREKQGILFNSLDDKICEIKKIINSFNNIDLLEGNVIEFEGRKYAGCSGGIDPSYVENRLGLNWYDFLESNNEVLNYKFGLDWSSLDFDNFFRERKNEMLRLNGKFDVLMTHYAPHYRNGLFLEERNNTYFNINDLNISSKIWVYGHVHVSVEENNEGVFYLNNSLGRELNISL